MATQTVGNPQHSDNHAGKHVVGTEDTTKYVKYH